MAEIIHGLNEFLQNLNKLDNEIRGKALVDGAKAGAHVVLEDAKQRAPKGRTGNLSNNMTIRVARSSDINEATADVGPDKKQWYGFFLEYGTKFITPRRFLQLALDSNTVHIQHAMESVIEKVIAKWQ